MTKRKLEIEIEILLVLLLLVGVVVIPAGSKKVLSHSKVSIRQTQ